MEGVIEKVCPNCGEKLPIDSSFCVKCGTKIDKDIAIIEQTSKAPKFFEKNKKKIIIGVVAVVAILVILSVVNSVQVSNLEKELKRGWYKVEGEGSASILCILDFSDDEVEYRLETGYTWMNTTVATYDYKVISGNKVKVLRYGDDWETITVEFNDDKTVMTVSPALTSVDKTEIWVNLD